VIPEMNMLTQKQTTSRTGSNSLSRCGKARTASGGQPSNWRPGAHHYRFLVDGQCRDEPERALHMPNPYGGQNSVRQVT